MVDTDYKKVRKFEGGLRNAIQEKVNVLKLPKYVDVLDRALMSKENLASHNRPFEWKGKRHGSYSNKGSSPSRKQNLGTSRHMARDCPRNEHKSGRLAASSTGYVPMLGNTTRPAVIRKTLRQWRVFALVPSDTRTTEDVISVTLFICNQNAYVLIKLGSTHSFASVVFASKLNRLMESLPYLLCLFASFGKSILCSSIYCGCEIRVGDTTLFLDLLPLDIRHFDVILGMDWLSKYCATIDYVTKQVLFRPPGHEEFVFVGNGVVHPPYLISIMKACKLLNKGCQGYLCSILTNQLMNIVLYDIPIVREFSKVFLEKFLGELVDR
ncbi:uncharacterized protein LOC114256964 [Camellia sinensis]|uniref:uncharacterized protein LOC114256964 n=1 Tax=Camellia sinensis TaxID=4442 RepID=UPI001035D7D2|nr:uncharacterized protein LOC114256964 [Camellia sinensis]